MAPHTKWQVSCIDASSNNSKTLPRKTRHKLKSMPPDYSKVTQFELPISTQRFNISSNFLISFLNIASKETFTRKRKQFNQGHKKLGGTPFHTSLSSSPSRNNKLLHSWLISSLIPSNYRASCSARPK